MAIEMYQRTRMIYVKYNKVVNFRGLQINFIPKIDTSGQVRWLYHLYLTNYFKTITYAIPTGITGSGNFCVILLAL